MVVAASVCLAQEASPNLLADMTDGIYMFYLYQHHWKHDFCHATATPAMVSLTLVPSSS